MCRGVHGGAWRYMGVHWGREDWSMCWRALEESGLRCRTIVQLITLNWTHVQKLSPVTSYLTSCNTRGDRSCK